MRTRALGAGTLLALALTLCLGVASASATGFAADQYPVEYRATGSGYFSLTTQGGTSLCSGPEFSAESSGETADLTAGTIKDSSCQFGVSAPLKMNGCTLSYHVGSQATKNSWNGTFDIGPPGCGPITVNNAYCQKSIPAQTGLAATFTNVGSGSTASISIELEGTGIEYTNQAGGWACNKGTYEDGSLSGTYKVIGVDSEGNQIGAFVAGAGHVPMFEAESYTASVAGSQVEQNVLSTVAGKAQCTGAAFDGQLAEASTDLTLGASYSGCSAFGFVNATVKMNSCEYVVDALNAGPPYVGGFSVDCATPGDSIKVSVPSIGCTVTVPDQSGLEAVSLANEGSGSARQVTADLDVSGLTYTASSTCPGPAGTFSDGTYTGSIALQAEDAEEGQIGLFVAGQEE